jgi:exopolysaccharide biosynthesis polyprenyl glycosylphosphotransferase
MKRSELVFTAILVPVDFLLVIAAALTARELRYGYFAGLRQVVTLIPFQEFLAVAAVAAGVFVLCFALAGLYAVSAPRRLKFELSRIFLASSTAAMGVIVLIFFRGEYFSSRFIVLAAWAIAVAYVSIGRVTLRMLQRALAAHGIGTRRVALFGGNDKTSDLLARTFASRGSGYAIAARFGSYDAAAAQRLASMAAARELDEIVVADPAADRHALERLLEFAQSNHIDFKYSADLLGTHARNMDIGALAGVPLIEMKRTKLDGWGRIFKRIGDILGSLALIILTSPIMLLTAIAIVIDSRGPLFFSRLDDGSPALRVGEGGKPFRYFKFRSMKPGTHAMRYSELAAQDTRAGSPLVKIKDDPRVTRVGKFIRRYSIDELPELFLVLMGHMSLVGPRPHLPEEVAKYGSAHRRVLTIKPGITGMAQVSGRSDLTFDEEVRLDTFYIENWTPWLDLAILARTPAAVLAHRAAE